MQPLELVYRNLEEYEESFSELPLSEVYRLYEQNETVRQGKVFAIGANMATAKWRNIYTVNITDDRKTFKMSRITGLVERRENEEYYQQKQK